MKRATINLNSSVPIRNFLKPLSWYRGLRDSASRQHAGVFLVEGPRAIGQICRSNPASIREILIENGSPAIAGVVAPVRELSRAQMRRICAAQTPQGMAAVVALPAGVYSAEPPPTPGGRILLLEHLQDPGNVGALIRTASALGFDGAILSGQCADPFSPKAVAASAGSILSIWIRKTPRYGEMAHSLQRAGWRLIATAPGGAPLDETNPPARLILALGNEGAGLSPLIIAAANATAGIPVDATRAQSLNVAACGAICMYALRKRTPQGESVAPQERKKR